MIKDSKDYTHYSKKNWFMIHNETKSFYILCDKSFNEKIGAQSHSSLMYHMTLDAEN